VCLSDISKLRERETMTGIRAEATQKEKEKNKIEAPNVK
jgi:hypothetical protein